MARVAGWGSSFSFDEQRCRASLMAEAGGIVAGCVDSVPGWTYRHRQWL